MNFGWHLSSSSEILQPYWYKRNYSLHLNQNNYHNLKKSEKVFRMCHEILRWVWRIYIFSLIINWFKTLVVIRVAWILVSCIVDFIGIQLFIAQVRYCGILRGSQCGIFYIGELLRHLFLFSKMPKQHTKEHEWDDENMRKAVSAVISKEMGYLAASQRFKVPRSTLFRYCPNKKKTGIIKKKNLEENLS